MNRGAPHRAARNFSRALMFIDATGNLRTLTSRGAKRLIRTVGSVRSAAAHLNVPKSTLHDLALDRNKLNPRR